uniref:hypothetical protein n=1 Tax=Enterocloster aldenensis TaxID=358742 RepID=UPI00140B6F62
MDTWLGFITYWPKEYVKNLKKAEDAGGAYRGGIGCPAVEIAAIWCCSISDKRGFISFL